LAFDQLHHKIRHTLVRGPAIEQPSDIGMIEVGFDSQSNVYISELYSGTAVKYGPKGGNPLLVISQGTAGCEGIAVDKSGNIYVANSTLNNITVYNPSGTLINTLN
jgi:sugar lactone lactonase YvrE